MSNAWFDACSTQLHSPRVDMGSEEHPSATLPYMLSHCSLLSIIVWTVSNACDRFCSEQPTPMTNPYAWMSASLQPLLQQALFKCLLIHGNTTAAGCSAVSRHAAVIPTSCGQRVELTLPTP